MKIAQELLNISKLLLSAEYQEQFGVYEAWELFKKKAKGKSPKIYQSQYISSTLFAVELILANLDCKIEFDQTKTGEVLTKVETHWFKTNTLSKNINIEHAVKNIFDNKTFLTEKELIKAIDLLYKEVSNNLQKDGIYKIY